MATRKNASPNPALKNNATGWGGGSTPTRSTGLVGLPRSTGAHYSANSYASTPAVAAGPGETWTLSVYFRNNTGTNLGSKTVYFVCQKPGDDFSITTSVALPTGDTRVSITGVTLSGTTGLYMLIDSFNATLGTGVEITAALFEKVSGPPDTYFDGDTVGAVWDGTDGNSSSTLSSGSDVIYTDTSGGAAGAGSDDPLTRVFVDTSGGSTGAGSSDALTRVFVDGSGGTAGGGSQDSLTRVFVDGSGGAAGAGSDDPLTRVFVDASGGTAAAGSADGLTRVFVDTSGGSVGAGSADTLPVSTIFVDTSGGAAGAGSPEPSVAPSVKQDTMVMPILNQALQCLREQAAVAPNTPLHFHLRPGADFEQQADQYGDECCDGIGWARMVANYEGNDENWLEPNGTPSNCPPSSWAVVIEIGLMRCIPLARNARGDRVTDDQWTAATQQQMDDAATLRRVLCCLRDAFDQADVTAGQIGPLPNSGGCGGVTIQVTIRADACDTCT